VAQAFTGQLTDEGLRFASRLPPPSKLLAGLRSNPLHIGRANAPMTDDQRTPLGI